MKAFLFCLIASLAIMGIKAQSIKSALDIEFYQLQKDYSWEKPVTLSSFVEKDKRILILYFASWCKPSIAEFDYLYEEGIIESCNSANITKILVTCERDLPIILTHYPDIIDKNSFAKKPSSNWPQRILQDFIILYEKNVYSINSLLNTVGSGCFPFGCLIENDSTISFSYTGFHKDEIDELKDRILCPKTTICENCQGTGINPNSCYICGGTGVCRSCSFDPDYYLHHCSSCNNSRICTSCRGSITRGKKCPKCKGHKTITIK